MKKLFFISMLAIIGLSACLLISTVNAQTHILYGTCSSGSAGSGTIFHADSNGNSIHTVYSFDNTNGADPQGNVVQAANNKIYGTTFLGGCGDSCVAFEYDPATGINLDVYDFYCNSSGAEPVDGMILGTDGNLYGMTVSGGNYGGGIIYRFNPDTHTLVTLYNFTSASGANPWGRLLQLNNKFYGMTHVGGTNNLGVIFSFDLSSSSYDTLYNFDGTHGANPYYGSLIQASNGKLYGMTNSGGDDGKGVIFSYDITTHAYNALYNFHNAYGGDSPFGSLIQATNGLLYGMTYEGGLYNDGVIFSCDVINSIYTVLVNFDGSNNGKGPYRELIQASNGKLYGTTLSGGISNMGVAFCYDINAATFTKLIDFDGLALGSSPQCDIFESGRNSSVGIASVKKTNPVSVFPSVVNNVLTIHNANSSSSVQYTITDFSGQTVMSGILDSQDTQIAVSSLSSGIYFITLSDNEGIVTRKFVKE